MAKNKITDLRDHLFEIIELLKDDEQTHMTIEKAKAISDVAQVIIIRVTPHGRKSVQYVVNSPEEAASMIEYAEGELP
mgnify:CR=1 FL=1